MDIPVSQILIVDDNPTNIKVLFDFLRNAGFRVLVAKSGETALDRLQAIGPDLVLLDVMMPGMDGFETCRQMKAMAIGRDIPIIFMTALSDTVDKVKGLSLGAVDYITKPFQQEEVLARIKIHLELYHLRKTLEQRVEERTHALQTTVAHLTQSQQQLQESQLQLVQHEKMSMLGNLIAGLAHEINNPIGFIAGNVEYALEYVDELLQAIDLYREVCPSPDNAVGQKLQAIDLDYIQNELPVMLQATLDGTNRIREISQGLRLFSRCDTFHRQSFNIHQGLDSTIIILKHRLKATTERPAIVIAKDYGNLPEIYCFPSQLNQVFMNLLANAIDALEESNSDRSYDDIEARPNQIMIQTAVRDSAHILISIADNGVGMTDDVKHRIFDYLFTTKVAGKGTGLGLAIVKRIIIEQHGGWIDVVTRKGQGTEFILTLPIAAPEPRLEAEIPAWIAGAPSAIAGSRD